MVLKAVLESLDDLDDSLKGEYKEVAGSDGKKTYVLDIENVQALPDFNRMNTALVKERNDHKATKTKFAPFQALGDPAELQAKLDRIAELEAAAEGKLDDNKINAIVEGRIKSKLAPIERERDNYKTQVAERDQKIGEFTAAETRRRLTGAVSKAAREAKVLDSATEDVELYAERIFEVQEDGAVVTRDNVGVTPGLSPKQWLEDMQAKRPHWWGATQGGGAQGNRGAGNGNTVNPWTAENWNMTEQGKILNTKGRAEADRLAKQAGTTVGGKKPAAKAAA